MGRRSARTTLLQAGWLTAQLPAARRFRAAKMAASSVQNRRLTELLGVLAPTAMGRELGLDRVMSPSDFQRRIPIGDYPSHEPWIARVAAGESGVMTTEPIELLERTSGTGGAHKLIPYTARLRAEFAEAVGAWMVDLHRHRPGLLGTRSYWSVSRATRRADHSEGGVPIGFEDDAAYFGPVTRWALGRLLAVPGTVAQSPSIDAWRLATATHLIQTPDLGLISVWSPSFLTQLFAWIADNSDRIRRELEPEARRRLDRATAGSLDATVLWPRLQVVSAWGDGFAASLVPAMRGPLPDVAFQPKGLLATEGVVSFPLWDQPGHALALGSHVVELRDIEDGRVLWGHEARTGARYQPLLTTGGGLVRYALPDVVEVVGFTGQVPRIRLVGRTDRASDLVGEKLTESFVSEILRAHAGAHGFAMLVPCADPASYVVVVDADPPDAASLDAALSQAYHYGYARELGQLSPVRVVVFRDAWTRWERAIEATGHVLGEQKPGALEPRLAVARHLLQS